MEAHGARLAWLCIQRRLDKHRLRSRRICDYLARQVQCFVMKCDLSFRVDEHSQNHKTHQSRSSVLKPKDHMLRSHSNHCRSILLSACLLDQGHVLNVCIGRSRMDCAWSIQADPRVLSSAGNEDPWAKTVQPAYRAHAKTYPRFPSALADLPKSAVRLQRALARVVIAAFASNIFM